jgi:hypothetical protein
MGDGHQWIGGVWFVRLVGHGYPLQEISLLDAGYNGHQKIGG